MRSSTLFMALAASVPAAMAQNDTMSMARPANISMCDYYTKAVFGVNNSTMQYTLLTALVNTAVIGNYSNTSMNAVTGILNNGTYEGRPVSLLKYFNGMLASTNRGGESGVSVNFLDGGAADPLKMNKPANGTESNQYFLLTHLYQYFGVLLNCSSYGKQGFPAYGGSGSQYGVHKFMDLSHDEVYYFIQEVGLAATSFGVTAEDAMAVGMSLNKVFNYRCAPNATVVPSQGAQAQSICIADDCPLADNSDCNAAPYKQAVMQPSAANNDNKYTSTSAAMPSGTSGSGSGSASGTDTASAAGSSSTDNVAAVNGLGAAIMGAAGLAALAVGL